MFHKTNTTCPACKHSQAETVILYSANRHECLKCGHVWITKKNEN